MAIRSADSHLAQSPDPLGGFPSRKELTEPEDELRIVGHAVAQS
jgi:hypothetical protein